MGKWDLEDEQRRFVESTWTDQRRLSPEQRPPKPPRSRLIIGIGVAGVVAIGSLLSLALVLRHSRKPTAVAVTAVPVVSATPAPVASASSSVDDQKLLAQRIMDAPNAVEAAKLSPLKDDIDDIGNGTMLFAHWAMAKMTWAEISGKDNTTFGRIMKEPDKERGKHGCWKGNVIEIQSKKSDAGQVYYIGGIMQSVSQPVRFVAVHSSGDIVADSTARICGTVVGTFSYANVVGGQTQAVLVVGMLDLPENHEVGADRGPPKPSTTGNASGLTN
jgi:hypothetical protein